MVCAAALTACAPSAERFGGPILAVEAGVRQSFVMGQGGDAADAVRQALLESGYEAQEEGLLRVDVGFAIRPRRVAVVSHDESGNSEIVSPSGQPGLKLCKRQSYILTIALVERSSGRIKARSGATMSRCGGTSSAVLPILARIAIGGIA